LADLTFDLKGTADVQGKIAAALLTMRDKAEAALSQVAEQEMTESKKRVPVDTGTLRDSGHVQQPERDAEGISVTMGYGGAAEDYAIVQHENLEFHHKVGQAKFLESVLQESAPYLLERIAKRIKL
jgi:hypothetical protein